MKVTNLGEYNSIPAYVSGKLARLEEMERSFSSLFELMFSERENIFFEKSTGYDIERATYGEVYDRIRRCTAGFIRLAAGLPQNAVVGLYMENSVEWMVGFWTILNSGFRPLLLNSRLSPELLRGALDTCGAKLVISDGRTLPGFETITLADIPEEAPLSRPPAAGTEMLVMSSGTSTDPKLCAYSAEELYHLIRDSRTIMTDCKQIKKHYKGQLKLLTFLPFYHVFGFIAVYMWFAFYSRTFVQLNDLSGQTIINTIRRHGVTHIFAVPLFWNEVHRQAVKTIKGRGESVWNKFQKGMALAKKLADLPLIGHPLTRRVFREVRDNLFGDSVYFCITGGSEITTEVLSFFNLTGYRLANGYGASEIGITSVELDGRCRVLNSGSVGIPLPSAEYKIDEDGVLLVRSRGAAKYVIEDGKTIPRPEWFKTWDLAECRDGRYYILGRKDDVVIAGDGENLNPCLVEPLLNGGSWQTCLIGARDSGGETAPVLLVYAGNHATAARYDAVRNEIVSRLQAHRLSAQIRKLVFVRDPLMGDGDIKLNRARLCRAYEGGSLPEIDLERAAAAGGDLDGELARVLKLLFAGVSGRTPEEIDPDMDFFLDGGGSSLDYFAMIARLQEDYDVRFPVAQDRTLTTLRGLYEFIKEAQEHVD